MNPNIMNGAESLLRTFVASGIDICFANPGTSEMHFVSALDRAPGMRAVLGLFEGVVTGAADGYARMAGKPAVTLLHLGPGLANGLANLHNARKGEVPVINVVGDHATAHRAYDAPLTADVSAFARPVSHWLVSTRDASTAAADGARAVQAARAAPGQIATLILPADAAWSPAERPAPPLPVQGPVPVSHEALAQAAEALRAGSAALLLRHAAARGKGLLAAGRIAAATGARLFCDTFAPRLERGAGRVALERVPYRPEPALAMLDGVKTLILVGGQPPIAFFAYPDQPSQLTPQGCTPLVLSHPHEDGTAALEALADLIGARGPARLAARGGFDLPADGGLDPAAIAAIVGHHLPEGAVVIDESVTGSFAHHRFLDGAAPHDVINLTGGAIGDGLPMATGAAVACPDRKVICMQADGSAMYTLQALWTQARYGLDVVTVIYANRSYKVLVEELKAVGAATTSPTALDMFDITRPHLDWVKLAAGMGVEGVRVETTRALSEALKSAVTARGPRLIEAVY
ncbi:acetolactate synthase large subunit [Xanthobacteraceae bacterium Astr-EGSB]|uniref:acetolactate synthase large subunit n=1 Tax=Astrobacterium formosum TaxID=3069710 RepID=UPI0027B79EA6|nr:acetolactate synthase large subunit [Xanthobacteraceae bacterium Astr-EGSB]